MIANITQDNFLNQDQNSLLQPKCIPLIAKEFLSLLANEKPVTFQTFDDNSERKDKNLVRVLHGTLDNHLEELLDLNKKGAGVFVTINETNQKGRTAADITKIRAAFVDLDGAPLDPILSAPFHPHMIIESSPNRYHAYWFIEDLQLDHFRVVQKGLADRFNGDPKVIDLPRVMRLPGFVHQKSTPFLSQIFKKNNAKSIKSENFVSIFKINLKSDQKEQKFEKVKNENSVLGAIKNSGCLLKADTISGRWHVKCPWSHLHTNKKDEEAHYYEPHTNGYSGHGFKCFHSHCSDRNGEDFLNWLGKEINYSLKVDGNWEDPIPLPQGLPPVSILEPEMIPESLRGWLLDIAERMQIPPDFSAASAIIVLSSLVGRKIGIMPKRKDDWIVVPNLWGAVVGRPSLLKSPAIAQVMKPLDSLVTDASKKHDVDMTNYKLGEMAVKARKEALQKKLNKEAEKNSNLEKFLENQKLDSIKEPILKRYKTEDGTVAKIGEILLENPNGILIHRDELTGWLKSLDKEGREGDRQFYLEAWNGSGSFTVDRIGRGTLHIPALCLSILGGIQPGPLSSYIYQALKGGAGDDGLIQRFQLLVWPDAPKEWKNIDRWPDTDAKKRAYKIFDRLDKYSHFLGPDDLDTEISAVRYSFEGQKVFDDWREKLERRLLSGELSPSMESHLAKYRSLMPSLSLIFQLCQNIDADKETRNVESEAAELAVRWCSYLETHAHRLYSSVESAGLDSAKALLLHLQKGDVNDGFSLRDIYLRHWSKLTTPDEVERAVNILVLHGWLRVLDVKTAGRPKQLIKIHPKLLEVKIIRSKVVSYDASEPFVAD